VVPERLIRGREKSSSGVSRSTQRLVHVDMTRYRLSPSLLLSLALTGCGTSVGVLQTPDAAVNHIDSGTIESDAGRTDGGAADAPAPNDAFSSDGGEPPCPSDLSTAIGTSCTWPNQVCGSCSSACDFCTQLTCSAGTWTQREIIPAPQPCTEFDCGTIQCSVEYQYCQHTLGGIPGSESYQCISKSSSCQACNCIGGQGGSQCEVGSGGGITVTILAP
jgi:hypothetical protein